MKLFPQPHFFQRLNCPLPSFCLSDSGNGQGEFYIRQYGLVRNQIVTLKYESYRMVPVRIPVSVFILFC